MNTNKNSIEELINIINPDTVQCYKCEKWFSKMDGSENHGTFELYHDYIETNAMELNRELLSQGYTHTHALDALTTLVILRKHGFPVSRLYSVHESTPLPKEIMHALAKKLFTSKGEGGSGFHGGLLDLGDIDND